MKRRKISLVIGAIMLLALLSACALLPQLPPDTTLTVTVTPTEGYPPLLVTITAYVGVAGGQYTFELGGKTYQQGENTLKATVNDLPCQGRVIWEQAGGTPLEAAFEIKLVNSGPIICPPRLNGIDDAWYLHPRYRYVVDFPGTYDPEGGSVTLIDAIVRAELKTIDDTIYCPPYQGPDVFHARTRMGHIVENAFVFHCLWTAPFDTSINKPEWAKGTDYVIGDKANADGGAYECVKDHKATLAKYPGGSGPWENYWKKIGTEQGTNLPFSPPGYGESGYPSGFCLQYDTTHRPSQVTTITATFEDEVGAKTTESWDIPTGADPGCNIYDNL